MSKADGKGSLGIAALSFVKGPRPILVKRILRKYGYPPDKQEKATQIVLEQTEVLSEGWVTND